MLDERQAADARLWSKSSPTDAWRWSQPETPLTRFLGGTPINVALRLFFLSLVVGALLMWLDIKPADIAQDALRFIDRIGGMGFRAFRDIGAYLIGGAMIVVPVWFVLRLVNMRGAR